MNQFANGEGAWLALMHVCTNLVQISDVGMLAILQRAKAGVYKLGHQ